MRIERHDTGKMANESDARMPPSSGAEIATASSSSEALCLKSKQQLDDVQFLDYLSTDLSYLKRFILASNQMDRLLQTETARDNVVVQGKLVDTIEIAKETLSEAGVSPRPFIACPEYLILHRQAYFKMLSSARTLVPYMKDPDVKLRLRRLLLPLTSTSRFRVVSISTSGRQGAENTARSPEHDIGPELSESGPTPPVKPSPPRKRMRRASTPAAFKLSQSRMSYSSCPSDSASRAPTSDSAVQPRRTRANPYPVIVQSEEYSSSSQCYGEAAKNSESVPPSENADMNSHPPQGSEYSTQKEREPSPEPIPYVSPMTPRPIVPPKPTTAPQSQKFPSLLQQQHQDSASGPSAYRKDLQEPSSTDNSDWSNNSGTPSRPSLSGIDCNVPKTEESKECPVMIRFSDEEYDEADANFRKGLGWRPNKWRPPVVYGLCGADLKWATRWDDDENPTPESELVMNALEVFPEPIIPAVEPAPLSESTCMIM